MRLLGRVLVMVATAMAAAAVTMPATAPSASAHGGEEALVVEPRSTWPGGTVTVRGDLPVTSDVHLLLADSAGRMTQVGRVNDPPSGHFDVPVTIPGSTRLGAWSIVAVAGGDAVGRVALTVGAAPPPAAERPDQAEPVLAPGATPRQAAPPAAGGQVPRAVPQEAARIRPPTAPDPTSGPPTGWLALALGVGAVGAVAVFRRRASRARGT